MIIDCLLFSDASESNMLFLKLTISSPIVDLFVLQQNAFNLKGQYKGLFADEVLKEERFAPFRHKVVIISAEEKMNEGNTDEASNFHREWGQRTMCYNYLAQNHNDPNNVILVSDTDELLCPDTDWRKTQILDNIDRLKERPCWVNRRRYWYDIDNECQLQTIRIPVLRWRDIQGRPDALYSSRNYHDQDRTFGTYDNPLAFEYSYYFKNFEDVWSKKLNYSHDRFTRESVENALHLNSWVRPKERGEKLNHETDYFETIPLTTYNSPQYVRDNLPSLKSNIVDPNYKDNRKNWTSEYT